MYSNLK